MTAREQSEATRALIGVLLGLLLGALAGLLAREE